MTRKAKPPRTKEEATAQIKHFTRQRQRTLKALATGDLTTRYRCRCGNTAETGIRLEAVTCTRCGQAMKATS